jgi:heme/copper-type cytochrome/quinol oxidase subunit 2
MSTLPPAPSQAPSTFPSHLPWAIGVTVASMLMVCILGFIAGIVAMVYGWLVHRRLDSGDTDGAGEASRSANVWCWIATSLIVIGLCVVAVFFYSGGWAKYQQIMGELERIHLHG